MQFFHQALIVVWLHHQVVSTTRICQNYENILPHGICLPYLKNIQIADTPSEAQHVNKYTTQTFDILKFTHQLFERNFTSLVEKVIVVVMMEKCEESFDVIKASLRNLSLQSYEEFYQCIESRKKFRCYAKHKVCIKHQQSITETTKSEEFSYSPPCYETCFQSKSGVCKKTIEMFRKLRQYQNRCRKLQTFDHQPGMNCSVYPKWTRESIFKCQLNLLKSNVSKTKQFNSLLR